MASLSPKTGTLGRRLAAHLLRRAAFGATRQEIDLFAGKTADEAVDLLLNFPPPPDHPKDPQTNLTWVVNGRTPLNSSNNELKLMVNSWWLHQFISPAAPLSAAHKLVFFLHTSFVTSLETVDWSENHYYTLRLLMRYAQGSYKELAKKICLDNGMNDFLDIGDSDKDDPNENFVREFLELFTIGKGPGAGPGDYTTFTEQDVTEGARLMTGFVRNDDWADPLGWDPDTGLPRATPNISRHDTTSKQFSARFNNQVINGSITAPGMIQEVSNFVEMIFAQDATAEYIIRRLYRFFVSYHVTAEVETDIIQPLAQSFKNNNFVLADALKTLLKSQHFYDEDDSDSSNEIIGALFKSPLELQSQMIRYFKLVPPDPTVNVFDSYVTFYRWGMQSLMEEACFDLFAPPEVAGYQPVFQAPDFNRLWISSKALPARYAIVDEHIDGPPELMFDLMAFVNDPTNITPYNGQDAIGNPGPHPGARISKHLVSELVNYLLPETLDQPRLDYLTNEALLDSLTPLNWQMEWDNYVSTGSDVNVRPQIAKLVRAILQSPEFQLG